MDLLSRIFEWLSDHEAGISAVAAILAIAVILFTGLRFLLRRRGEATEQTAPNSPTAEPAPAAGSSPADLDPLTVPGFEGRPAIAVLPFDNLSGDPEQEYFADGIAEDLITRLSVWRNFPVIARNSSFTYKGKPVDVKQVSRELGVRYVVEGSVRKAEDRVRISAQLIDANTGAHVWAETYDREIRDIFALQDEITETIVASMHPELERFEWERAVRKEPGDLDAWDYAQRGWWHLNQQSRSHNAEARLFEKALELDAHLARAFFGLTMTHFWDIANYWSESPAQSIAELELAAQRSVALADQEPFGQLALGIAFGATGQLERMIAAFENAVELNPSLASAHFYLGAYLAITGAADQGLARIEQAMRLSPRDPEMWRFLHGVALAHFAAGRYEEAVRWDQRSLRQKPAFAFAHRVLAASYGHLGRIDEARAALERMFQINPEFPSFAVTEAPWLSPSFLDRVNDGLRKAGLPE